MTLEEIRHQLEEASALGERERTHVTSTLFSADGVTQQVADSADASLIALAADEAVQLVLKGQSPDVRERLLSIDALQTVARDGTASQIQRVAAASQGSSSDHLQQVAAHLYTPQALARVAASHDGQAVATVAICLTYNEGPLVAGGLQTLLTAENLQRISRLGSAADIGLAASACQRLPPAEATSALEALLTPEALKHVAAGSGRAEFIGWVADASRSLPEGRKVEAIATLLHRTPLDTLRNKGSEGDIALVAIAVADSGHASLIARAAEVASLLDVDRRNVAMEYLLTDDAIDVVERSGTGLEVGAVARAASLLPEAPQATEALGRLLTPDALGRVADSRDQAAIARTAEAAGHLDGAARAAALEQLLSHAALTIMLAKGTPASISRVVRAAADSGHVQVLARTALLMAYLHHAGMRDFALRTVLTEPNLARLATSNDASAIGWAATAVGHMKDDERPGAFDRLLTPEALNTLQTQGEELSMSRVAMAVGERGGAGLVVRIAQAFGRLPDGLRAQVLPHVLSETAMKTVAASRSDKAIHAVVAAVRTLPLEQRHALMGALLKGVPPWQQSLYNPSPARSASAAAASPSTGGRKTGGPGLG
ncbi:hypothetical protein [Hydrogenophaga sp.]|uniref:hypothetical protein n=1 Tax=Hydrogenophaga sp. TaxID=1904254 RepID=UPI003F6F9264